MNISEEVSIIDGLKKCLIHEKLKYCNFNVDQFYLTQSNKTKCISQHV